MSQVDQAVAGRFVDDEQFEFGLATILDGLESARRGTTTDRG
jgi:hypothetical protein